MLARRRGERSRNVHSWTPFPPEAALKREVSMQPVAKRARCLSAVLLALASLVGGSDRAHALTNGWNLIEISVCYGGATDGADYLYIYPKSGGYLYTLDPLLVTVVSNFCVNGNAFYAYLTGGSWNGVALYPGFK